MSRTTKTDAPDTRLVNCVWAGGMQVLQASTKAIGKGSQGIDGHYISMNGISTAADADSCVQPSTLHIQISFLLKGNFQRHGKCLANTLQSLERATDNTG